ncbi:hypothetical protein [Novosphingobium sp. B 225]|uniref:hypothetical protein n=1 Tax=Novosphingobium sp. B 225 TaxID=1961849 RepID=UPI000B4BB973|nr:hypothetical protein [Novosphingobium sp. B 225]
MGLGALLIAASALGTITFAAEAEVTGPTVRLGDVAELSAVPESLRRQAAGLPLARLALDQRRTVMDRAELAARARALMPVLRDLLPAGSAPVTILRHTGLPALPLASGAAPGLIRKGEPVSVAVRAGPVMIRRSAKALQGATAGEQLFVATAERDVLTAVCCGE